jgi:hypothetical protein
MTQEIKDRVEQLEELVRLGEKVQKGVLHQEDGFVWLNAIDHSNGQDYKFPIAESCIHGANFFTASANNRENIKWILDRVKSLETKLETCPSGYDGIDCRDETIKGLEDVAYDLNYKGEKVSWKQKYAELDEEYIYELTERKKQAEAIEVLRGALVSMSDDLQFPSDETFTVCLNHAQESLEKAEEILK